MTKEVDERVLASGEVYETLKKASLSAACKALKAEGVEAVAVCFLHAYATGRCARRRDPQGDAGRPPVAVARHPAASRVRRMPTTVVNAYIGPKVGGYV
jgi:N-methylhydantoinase A